MRWLSALLLLPIAALAVINGSWLLSTLYSKIKPEPGRYDAPTALASSAAAIRFAPWRPSAHADHARILYATGRPADEVHAEFHQALHLAPADAYQWQGFAAVLAAQNRFDRLHELAVVRVNTLAPTSRALQAGVAEMGVKHWFRGTAELQQQWLRSMSFQLRNDPRRFFKLVYWSGNRYWLCATVADDLPAMRQWCAAVWAQEP